ncbi:MAG: hypothetical protein OXN23_06275 [Gammaproteobacteria bacterium]|nr:hypothetical protein [Gammaproteobacteria bacterium]
MKMIRIAFLASLVAGTAHAESLTVQEGDTVDFSIVVTHPQYVEGVSAKKIRLWYDTDGGTATEGEDYETAHSWRDHVTGEINSSLTISVETFSDDVVEGDETFSIRMRKLEQWVVCAPLASRHCTDGWREVPMRTWVFTGAKTAVIEDVTVQDAAGTTSTN